MIIMTKFADIEEKYGELVLVDSDGNMIAESNIAGGKNPKDEEKFLRELAVQKGYVMKPKKLESVS